MLSTNQAVHIPSGDPEKGSWATLSQPGQLGHKFEWNVGAPSSPLWVTYRIAKAKAGVTFATGEILYWDDRDDYVVTNVANGGAVAGFVPAGTTAVAPTAGEYFCMVTKGRRLAKYLDSVTVAPDTAGKLVVATATAGRVDCVTATLNLTALVVGRTAGAQNTATKLALTDINVFDQA